ncbi:MAG: hypothetical protein HYZ42_07885 [Bacteroidetes bacterium]|nr:hypothetical protein [Bacteroidota bacterium]
MKKIVLFIGCYFYLSCSYGQTSSISSFKSGAITTTVPFLLIETNPQAKALGGIGVVGNGESYMNGMNQNPALLAQNNKIWGCNYTNYNQSIFGLKMSAQQGNIYYSIDSNNIVGISYLRFNLGSIVLTNALGDALGIVHQ